MRATGAATKKGKKVINAMKFAISTFGAGKFEAKANANLTKARAAEAAAEAAELGLGGTGDEGGVTKLPEI
jgi:hypothetical protein